MAPKNLLKALKQYFGYDSFRPLQEEIVQDALEGRDVFALLPTGGGKSLCFQLPALLQDGLTVVVSPLIALMKDQVDSLSASGIAATYLNSTLDGTEAKARFRNLHRGEYRLLYVAPERLMLSGFLENLKSWNISRIAIDEAHCISEWGHDFRPEYRQLETLRGHLPNVPMMALTATATERVRADIVEHLALRDPQCYVASFNRPNLFYRVLPKDGAFEQTLDFIRQRKGESGIVYCQSRKTAESVAERLKSSGISALPYHAGLEPTTRAHNQELFIRDKVSVVCATIAFGMGINKPNVRYVIHYDLPKNIEGYYQETGRAGRDGLPSECLLLFSSGDAAKQQAFIDDKSNPDEQQIARAQLQQMVHYGESAACRRATLLGYFGEEFPEPCGACDNCLFPRETFDGTIAAQKFLSCIFRLRKASNFGVGINHVIDILLGTTNDKIERWGHQNLSTFGIGREYRRSDWQHIGRELIRLGLCRQTAERFSVLELTPEGLLALKNRVSVTLFKPIKEDGKKETGSRGAISCDEGLFEKLRELRKQIADERDVPAYVIFSDVTLRLMARNYPVTEAEISRISGVGDKKLREFGEPFMDTIQDWVGRHPRQIFSDSATPLQATAQRKPATAPATAKESYDLFNAGHSFDEIARKRGLSVSTVVQHISRLVEAGAPFDLKRIATRDQLSEMAYVFAKHGFEQLGPIKEELGRNYTYEQLHLYRAVALAKRSK